MRTITTTYNVYTYDELSDDAKEKVKQWYLDDPDRSYFFSDDVRCDLDNIFGNNDLKFQYSLSYCQGDGFNIYGDISASAILDAIEDANCPELYKYKNALTDEEKNTIRRYDRECVDDISLPENRHYCYCIADKIDVADQLTWQLENYADIENIDTGTIDKFERLMKNVFFDLCNMYAEWGYNYFYEISDDDMSETCDANEWEFLEDGTLFV